METRQPQNEEERLQEQLVGTRYIGASLSGIKLGGDVDERILTWLKKKQGFLVYLGSPGVGKTHFCAALIPWLMKKVNSFRYWKERDLLSRIRSSIDRGDYIREISYVMDDEFVMIDDIGSSGFTEWRAEVLFSIVDCRYESKKPTVITSNFTADGLIQNLGARAVSRLFATENLVIEAHDHQDLRKKGF